MKKEKKGSTSMISFRMSGPEYEAASKAAEKEKISLSELIRRATKYKMEQEPDIFQFFIILEERVKRCCNKEELASIECETKYITTLVEAKKKILDDKSKKTPELAEGMEDKKKPKDANIKESGKEKGKDATAKVPQQETTSNEIGGNGPSIA